MRILLVSVLLALTSPMASAATAAVNNVEQYCGGLLTTPPGTATKAYFSIWAGNGSETAAQAYMFRKDGVQYSIAAGTYFHARCICSISANGTTAAFQLLTATASFSDGTAIASLTGPVYQGTSATALIMSTGSTNYGTQCTAVPYNMGSAGSTVYPGIEVGGTSPDAVVFAIGYESTSATY